MPAKIILLILAITFYSCGTKSSQVEASFHRFLKISKEGPLVLIKELITEDSKKYIDGLIEMTDSLNYGKAEQFGFEDEVPGVNKFTAKLSGKTSRLVL